MAFPTYSSTKSVPRIGRKSSASGTTFSKFNDVLSFDIVVILKDVNMI